MFDKVVVLGHRAKPAFAAAALPRVCSHRSALDVAVFRHRDGDIFIGDQVFDRILGSLVDNLGTASVAKFFLYVVQLVDDYAAQ